MLKFHLFSLFISAFVLATPPACFLSCINELAHYCPNGHTDLLCLCQLKDSLVGCLVDICPLGNLDSGRDHFVGTCLEHGRLHEPTRHAMPVDPVQQDDHGSDTLPADFNDHPRAALQKPKQRGSLMKQGTPHGSRKDGSVISKRQQLEQYRGHDHRKTKRSNEQQYNGLLLRK